MSQVPNSIKEFHQSLQNRKDISLEDRILVPLVLGVFASFAFGFSAALLLSKGGSESLSLSQFAGCLLVGQVAFLVIVRRTLSKYIFSALNLISDTIFARHVFQNFGGVAVDGAGRKVDGRVHIAHVARSRALAAWEALAASFQRVPWLHKLFQKWGHDGDEVQRPRPFLQGVSIERVPEPPRIDLEEFSNDEFGQIASAIEEGYDRQQKLERLLSDWVEALPTPAVVLGFAGKFVHANREFFERMKFNFSEKSQFETMSGSEFLELKLQLNSMQAKRVLQVLDHSQPRIIARECDVGGGADRRKMKISVATVSISRRKVGILVLEDAPGAMMSKVQEIVTDSANNQLKILQKIASRCAPMPDVPWGRIDLSECETLIDQVNSLFEAIHLAATEKRKQKLEFNLAAFFKHLPERLNPRIPVLVDAERDMPAAVIGDPTHLRQCIKTICDLWADLNAHVPMRIGVRILKSSNELRVDFGPTHADVSFRRPEKANSILDKLLLSSRLEIRPVSGGVSESEGLFFAFVSPLTYSTTKMSFIRLDYARRLLDKRILFAHIDSPEDATVDMCRQIKCFNVDTRRVGDGSLQQILHNFDVMMVFSSRPNWSENPDVRGLVRRAVELGVPAVLMPGAPHRGDSQVAAECGFEGYLSRPCSVDELETLLMVLCDPVARPVAMRRGLVTRYSVQELLQNTGSVLLADFEAPERATSDLLFLTLARLGFRITRSHSVNHFIEQLRKSEHTYVLYPAITTQSRVRRRLSLELRGQNGVAFRAASEEGGEGQLDGADPLNQHVIEEVQSDAHVVQTLQKVSLGTAPAVPSVAVA